MDSLIDRFNNLEINNTTSSDEIDDLIDDFVHLKIAPTDKKYPIVLAYITELLAKRKCCSSPLLNFVPKFVY